MGSVVRARLEEFEDTMSESHKYRRTRYFKMGGLFLYGTG
jgi:hypothetical protein